jgi:hypothetical protein
MTSKVVPNSLFSSVPEEQMLDRTAIAKMYYLKPTLSRRLRAEYGYGVIRKANILKSPVADLFCEFLSITTRIIT